MGHKRKESKVSSSEEESSSSEEESSSSDTESEVEPPQKRSKKHKRCKSSSLSEPEAKARKNKKKKTASSNSEQDSSPDRRAKKRPTKKRSKKAERSESPETVESSEEEKQNEETEKDSEKKRRKVRKVEKMRPKPEGNRVREIQQERNVERSRWESPEGRERKGAAVAQSYRRGPSPRDARWRGNRERPDDKEDKNVWEKDMKESNREKRTRDADRENPRNRNNFMENRRRQDSFEAEVHKESHRDDRDIHRDKRDVHRNNRDGHRENRDGHRENRDTHRDNRDVHRDYRDAHRDNHHDRPNRNDGRDNRHEGSPRDEDRPEGKRRNDGGSMNRLPEERDRRNKDQNGRNIGKRDRIKTEEGNRHRFEDVKVKNEPSPEWGSANPKEENKNKPVDKEKPNFEVSGKLTEDANTVNGVVIKYTEPQDARKPKRRWRLYPFKGEKALPTLYVHRQSAYLMGRDRKVADIPLDHPSCSKQHAALQFRLVAFQRDGGGEGRRIRPYLIDLDSANGTFVNNVKMEARRYHELLERDVLRFGFSSREYVVLHEHSRDDALDDDVPFSATTQVCILPSSPLS